MKSIAPLTRILLFCTALTILTVNAGPLDNLENYQVNTPDMVSSGLPSRQHFEALQSQGVTRVIDLIPGDRTEEIALLEELGLDYHNIQVDWHNPTLTNFQDYVGAMNSEASSTDTGITLTHCKLNWRGAVFTYLYRVTQLNERDEIAKGDLLAIWTPDDTWQAFIDDVKKHYAKP